MGATPTWPVASGSMFVGFCVAQATGVRPLGGVVLAAGALWCGLQWRREIGMGRALTLVAIYLAAFAASHLIAHGIGAWPSVVLVSALVGGASWALADARPRPARTA